MSNSHPIGSGALRRLVLAGFAVFGLALPGRGEEIVGQDLPTGQRITPEAAPGAVFQHLDPQLRDHPGFETGQAVTAVTSPDGRTLLVLTSGYNLLFDEAGKKIAAASNEYVFVFDIAAGAPRQRQALPVPDTDGGIAFAPDGMRFYVGGGVDDNLHVFGLHGDAWAEEGAPIALGHGAGNGIRQPPSAAGLAVTADGRKVVIADRYNDAVTVVDPAARRVLGELDLRPGRTDGSRHGVAGGEYPDWVAVKGNDTAYVSSQRDRQVVVIDIAGDLKIEGRIGIAGTPNRMLLNADRSLLFVAADNGDTVSVIDTATRRLRETMPVGAPSGEQAGPQRLTGAAPNDLALSSDGRMLYVTEGGINALAVVPLTGQGPHRAAWWIPTGWYPHSVAVGDGGRMLYVVNGRSDPGPNPGGCSHNHHDPARFAACQAANRYILQISKAGLLSFPLPRTLELRRLTGVVAANNHLAERLRVHDRQVMQALRRRIRHVIYVIKENRTYDQVLGDLGRGNGDPRLALFGAAITPNQHALARDFVTLDNFFDAGEVSGNGWPWSTEARETDVGVKSIPLNYARRGAPYDVEGTNRNINVGLPTLALRRQADPATPDDPDLLPGTADVAAADGPDAEAGRGHLWDAALRAGLTVRNYGFYCDLARYAPAHPQAIPLDRDPFRSRTAVAFPADPALIGRTDPYFRGFDMRFPDFYREREWEREFAGFIRGHNLPNLMLVRLMTDHLGAFGQAIDRVNTPEAQAADNDYALGRLVEAVARSPYRDSTLIFVLEDDAQDGPDHVDAHRSTAFVAGPYLRQGAVVSARYSTVNMIRTIEEVLGLGSLNLNDAHQPPMTEAFDLAHKAWRFSAAPSAALGATALPLPQRKAGRLAGETFAFAHDAAYWAARTAGYDWSAEDRIDGAAFNRVLWEGLAAGRPYPAAER